MVSIKLFSVLLKIITCELSIVINSFFDGDLAVDYANKLAVDGFDSKILAPSDKKSFSRVVINEEFGSWQEAEANKAQFTEVFGDDIWVLKY